ncbi:ComEC/Rec2 family competence protein [Terasakiella pusilla]|uniref:ComEC/Rec2 family competence protein n=1 Tax=Terasakiella pusilla TaxID=64973 RepID=UPI003AA9D4B2
MLQKKRHNYLTLYKRRIFDDFAAQEKDHIFLLIPILLAIGIGLYFGMTNETPLWVALTGAFISGLTTYYLREYYIAFLSTLSIAIVLTGFSSAQIRTHYLDTNFLPYSFGPTGIQGRIASVTPSQKGYKIILEDLQISRLRADHIPTRVRLHANSLKTQIKPGQWIETRAMLKPPPQPASPLSFDFQRHAYFQGIGAIGFTYGQIKVLSEEASPFSFFENLRHVIQEKITHIFPNTNDADKKALAIALLSGNKQLINEETHEAVRAAGLAHLLAISGLHIGLVSAIFFFGLRSLLALIPSVSLNYPVKKWAAFLAIAAALCFTLTTGASTPTVRAFLMTSIVLLGVILDRKAISLRTVAWAAIAILILLPESLLSPSFQLSFAAVTALVAYYEKRSPDLSSPSYIRYVKSIFTSSLIATAATTPFAAYHFNHIALYGVASNLVAIPITVFWIMPSGLLALCLMPFGLEGVALHIMGWGIELLVWVAYQTANIPFSQIATPSMGVPAIIALTIAGLMICLMTKIYRKTGVALIGVGFLLASLNPLPDIVINETGKLSAIKDQEGNTYVSNLRHASFTRENWLQNWGLENHKPVSFQKKLPCDQTGCQFQHKNGTWVSFNEQAIALEEDCQKADILITPWDSPMICDNPKHIIDKKALKRSGAHAIYLGNGKIEIETVRDNRGLRPWTQYGR